MDTRQSKLRKALLEAAYALDYRGITPEQALAMAIEGYKPVNRQPNKPAKSWDVEVIVPGGPYWFKCHKTTRALLNQILNKLGWKALQASIPGDQQLEAQLRQKAKARYRYLIQGTQTGEYLGAPSPKQLARVLYLLGYLPHTGWKVILPHDESLAATKAVIAQALKDVQKEYHK